MPRTHTPKLSDTIKEQIIDMYINHMAYPINIARQFVTNKAHILKLLHEANVV